MVIEACEGDQLTTFEKDDMADSLKHPYLRKVDKRGDIQVWIVDGSYVRGHIDEEFTNFGQHYRYAYIPKNEFWIDEEAEHDERKFFTDHLLVEHQLMAKGMPYDEALVEADKAERKEKQNENEISIWRKLDHIAIFFMIAGTYTPVCYVYLSGYWKWSVIIIQWALVITGLFLKFFYLKAPRYFSTIIYLLMGWIGIVAIKEFLITMPPNAVFYLFAGGISFTVGAIFYAIKKPVFGSGLGFHEIFHLFVLLGGVFHYLLVYTALAG